MFFYIRYCTRSLTVYCAAVARSEQGHEAAGYLRRFGPFLQPRSLGANIVTVAPPFVSMPYC